MFLTGDDKLIELPPDLTLEEAVRLEFEGKAAEKKLGKGPAPKPVPDVKKLSKKEEKPKPKAAGKGKGARGGKGKAGRKFRGGGSPILKGVGAGKVAQYLAAKAGPVLLRGFGRLQKLRQNEQTHDDAGEKLTQTEKAVVIPLSEGQSKSNAGQVTGVSERPAPVVYENKGKQKLQEKLAENIPKSVEDVDNFKRDKKGQHTGADVMKVVQGDKDAVVSTFQDMGHTPAPAPREHEPENLPPQEVAPSTAGLNLGQGAIAPLQKEHTDVSKFTKEADDKLKEEGVTQEQLDMVDSGDLAKANQEKKGMEKTAKTEPLAVQKLAQQETAKVDKDLNQQETKQRNALKAQRKAGLGATAQKQKKAKSDLEKKREEVAAKINGIYTAAQDKVKKKLADLETQSMKRFDEGNAAATREFEDTVNSDLDAFKADRYSGWFGWARKARDWWKGMDDLPEVEAIFSRNRSAFVKKVDALVENISKDNKRVIQDCKDELLRARAEIKTFVESLKPGLQDIGKKAAEEMNSKLDAMDEFIAKKEEDLQNQLKDKQTAAIKAIDEKIEKMKEAMAGALAKLGKLLLWAAKKFFTWALEKFGFSLSDIESIINKGAAVLKAIFTGPIKFVKNLIKAASTGFENFGKNFLKHLKNAVFEWLTGSLDNLKLPDTWDLKGILSVVFQMLGITYDNIRAHLVKYIPEKVVKGLEISFDLLRTIVKEGPMAAWEQLKQIGEDMKEAFITAVKDWIKWKIVQKAIETVLSLFIPGAGIVRAIIAIYDTVVFFIQKAKDIMRMIGNFLGSISEIAAGNIGAAATALEEGLARGLVLVIEFLARFLRLSGITAKIRAEIQKVRAKVDGVLDKVAKWIADKAKKLVHSTATAAKGAVQKVMGWLGFRVVFKTRDGQDHSLYFERRGKEARLIRSSNEHETIEAYLSSLDTSKMTDAEKKDLETAKALAKEIRLITRDLDEDKVQTTAAEEKEIIQNVSALSKVLRRLGGLPEVRIDDLPDATWGKEAPPKQAKKVERLSSKSATGGSTAEDRSDEWDYVVGKEPRWVRMHLIPYSVGGKGDPTNWIPAPDNVNTSAAVRNSFEESLETAVRSKAISGGGMQPRDRRATQPNIVWVDSRVTKTKERFDDTTRNKTLEFPDQVRLTFGLYAPDPKSSDPTKPEWAKVKAPLSDQTVDIGPLPGDMTISLSFSSETAMGASALPHLTGEFYSNRFREMIKEMRKTARFAKWSAFEKRLLDKSLTSRLFNREVEDTEETTAPPPEESESEKSAREKRVAKIVADLEGLEKEGKLTLR